MRLTTVLSVIAIQLCFVLACSRNESAQTSGADATGTAAGTASEPGAAPLPAGNAGYDYVCGDGLTFNARIAGGNAILTLEGKTLTLAPMEAASGAHFSGEGATFIAMGEQAMLALPGRGLQTCKAK